ncbi:GFA family protein [Phenylobacterium sp.]|uniref:GFA family protein n=1 Tax=Phenylobacterium sp. TaxID=1871053 RepID=UPI002B929BD8|nr:GFA family protein [Phenylobacterium sp.]HLZ74321.1 GFA family protein [Phenylobacterium sp.]
MSLSGGCQCGAIRFRVDGELGEASICHCRMCQKAMGAFFGPFVEVGPAGLAWTRGARKRFQSSNKIHRGFCGDCGTPLTFEYGETHLSLAIAAFDRPGEIRISEQLASSARLADFAELAALPTHPEDEPRAAAHIASIVSYQHPDHDTETWPPKA